MRRIAVINQKGGVGKTTTSTNLGAALAEAGRRVVVVDIDPQANLSLHMDRMPEKAQPTIYQVLTGECTFAEAIVETAQPGLRMVPSTIDLSGAETELASALGRETILSDAIQAWVEDERARTGRAPADYLIFDCPPSLGLLALNALSAATEVLVTVQTEFLALQGMSKLVEIVQLVKRRLNPDLVITGILPCLYDSRLRLAREVLAEVRRYFTDKVFRTTIGTNVKLAEAPSYGQTILQYAPESRGAADYRLAAIEVMEQEGRDPELAALPRAGRAVPTPAVASAAERTPEPPKAAPESLSPDTLAPVTLASETLPGEPSPHAEAGLEEAPASAQEAEVEAAPEYELPRPAGSDPERRQAEPGGGPLDETRQDHAHERRDAGDRRALSPAERLQALESSPLPPVSERRGERLLRASELPPLPTDVFDSFAEYLRRHG